MSDDNFEYALLHKMFLDDLEMAAQFCKLGKLDHAANWMSEASTKLNQLQAVAARSSKTLNPPSSPAIDV